MAYLEPSFLIWSFGFIQITGLASAWLARLTEGSKGQGSFQWLFLGCLALMGLTTMASLGLGTKYWLTSSTTLAVMMLAAVWDLDPTSKHAPSNGTSRNLATRL